MAALQNFETRLEQLTRSYSTQLQKVAAPALEHVSSLDEIYLLYHNFRRIFQEKELSRRQRRKLKNLARATEMMALLAHLKVGDRCMIVAQELYSEHRHESDFLHSINYSSAALHIQNAQVNYHLARHRFAELYAQMPHFLPFKGEKVKAVKFRGGDPGISNYLTAPLLESRLKYARDLYHAINSGAECGLPFSSWSDTVGKGFLEIKLR